jgi:transposase InsO family protein
LGAELSFARVRRPTDNALTERFYGTIKQEEIYLVGELSR